MPRGNDEEGNKAAAAELADDFAQGAGNAEELIIANAEAHDQELVAAGMKKVDVKATEEAVENLDSFEGPDGEEALDVAVRGGVTVVAYEDESGRLQKYVAKSADSSKKAKAKSSAKAKSAKAEAE